jgi:hypothetical protein
LELIAPPLNAIQRQSRYGPKYLSLVVAQAGGAFSETSIDEDTMAIDATVRLGGGFIVDVQVKATYQYALDGTEASLTWPLKETWIEKWRRHPYPLYLVIVVVPDDSASWLDHSQEGTMLARTAAYWARVDVASLGGARSIAVPREQRLTHETMVQWLADSRALFGSGGEQ